MGGKPGAGDAHGGLTLIRLETREKEASMSACAREWSASKRRLRSSICEATELLRSPTLDAPAAAAAAAAGGEGWGDAAGEGEGEAAATRGERAAGLALPRGFGLDFGGEAEDPGEERKPMLRSAGEEPGDDDAGEEAPRRTARLRDAGACDASGNRKEGSCLGLGLRLGLEEAAATGVARGLPMAPLQVGWPLAGLERNGTDFPEIGEQRGRTSCHDSRGTTPSGLYLFPGPHVLIRIRNK